MLITPKFALRLRTFAERARQRKADKIGVGIGIGVEKELGRAFGHEKLDSPLL